MGSCCLTENQLWFEQIALMRRTANEKIESFFIDIHQYFTRVIDIIFSKLAMAHEPASSVDQDGYESIIIHPCLKRGFIDVKSRTYWKHVDFNWEPSREFE
jgi:hypothetical protein